MSDPSAILLASGISSVLATLISNPFEVLKIRQQTSGVNCVQHNQPSYYYNYIKNKVEIGAQSHPLNNYKYLHSVAIKSPELVNYQNWWEHMLSQLRSYLTQHSQENQKLLRINVRQISCSCISTASVFKAVTQIYQNEGMRTFFNGWRYAIIQASISNMLYFTCYEQFKLILNEKSQFRDRYSQPLAASGLARLITTTVTFPLEYWKVLQSSVSGYSKKKNLMLGTKLYAAYAVTLQRDVIFSCLFWLLLENTKYELKQHTNIRTDMINLISGVIAGGSTALFTLPLDVVKTRKQVSTRVDIAMLQEGGHMSTITILKQILDKEGLPGLFKGYKPRILKVTVHAGFVYMMYEKLKQRFTTY